MHGVATEFISGNSYLLPDGSLLDIAFCGDVHQTTSQAQVKAAPGSIILPHFGNDKSTHLSTWHITRLVLFIGMGLKFQEILTIGCFPRS